MDKSIIKIILLVLMVFMVDIGFKCMKEPTQETKKGTIQVTKVPKAKKQKTPRKVIKREPRGDSTVPSPSPSPPDDSLDPEIVKKWISKKTPRTSSLIIQAETFKVKMIQNDVINPKVFNSGGYLGLSGKKKILGLVPIEFKVRGSFYRDLNYIRFLVKSVDIRGKRDDTYISIASEKLNKYLSFEDKGYDRIIINDGEDTVYKEVF